MKDIQKKLNLILANMATALILCRLLHDTDGMPQGYEYGEVNQAFLDLTGLGRDQVIGRRLGAGSPQIEADENNWARLGDEVVLRGQPVTVEQYSGNFAKWLLINIFAPQQGYLAVLLTDINQIRERERDLLAKSAELSRTHQEIAAVTAELERQRGKLQQKKALFRLREDRYKTLADNSRDIIYSCDCEGEFTAVNQRFCESVRLAEDQIIGRKIADIFNNDFINKKWRDTMARTIATKKSQNIEMQFPGNDGMMRWYDITYSPIMDSRQNVIGVTGTNHDITNLKNKEMKILHMAYYDPLTDLPNRSLFFDRLNMAVATAQRNNSKVAVALFDMDDFKKVNDSLGHEIGDRFLIEISQRIRSRLRQCDTLSRLNGDKFSILIQNIRSFQGLLKVIERIRAALEEPFQIENNLINLTVSIGLAIFPEDGENADELIRNADTAMHKAKELGKNGYQLFNITMKNELLRKLQIEQLLHKALGGNEFILHYQPQFAVPSKKLRGFEALIRWNNPELGFLSPMQFIPVAEETGLIVPIGKWVLAQAVQMLKRIELDYSAALMMSVNISPIQLRQNDFPEMVLDTIRQTGLPPSRIELEVTENIFIDDYESAVAILTQLKKAGVRIALDDFGTGYSSLSYLRTLPIHALKIDKSFVREIDPSNLHFDLCQSIIALVDKLNIETIAEGVENQEQLDYLVEAKCDNLQGFYLGRPVSADQIGDFVKKGFF